MKNEPAFPTVESDWSETNDCLNAVYSRGGLTKRELFAAMAMQGLLSAVYSSKDMLNEFTKREYSNSTARVSGWVTGCEAVSRNAVSYADALIAELEKK